MRIVSLLPAATEWVAVLQATDWLVGRSHECDYPASVRSVPAITTARISAGASSEEIQQEVVATLQEGLSLYLVDLDLLRSLAPDIILTQAQCDVCAVSLDEMEQELAAWTEGRPSLMSLSPLTFKEVLDAALRLGTRLNRAETAMDVIGNRERRLQRFRQASGRQRAAAASDLPSVVCIEWLDPLMTAGHWMPDLVEHAGGRPVLAEGGAPSERIGWEALREADPDVLAIMPCGFSIEQTRRDLHRLTDRKGWGELSAVRAGRVYLFDGNAYFNRPGPRLYRAVELLGTALHPHTSWPLTPEPWERQRL
jgi:iron complex transport system substrate-binding protein